MDLIKLQFWIDWTSDFGFGALNCSFAIRTKSVTVCPTFIFRNELLGYEHRLELFRNYFPVYIDDRRITHLICVRLRHLLYDFLGGALGPFLMFFLYKRAKAPPKKSYRSSQKSYRQSCYSWEFISRTLPLPLPSWNSDELPLPLPSWPPQSPLDFHWLPITV